MTINTPQNNKDGSNLWNLYTISQSSSDRILDNFWKENKIILFLWESADPETVMKSIEDSIDEIKKHNFYAFWSEWEIYKIIAVDKDHGIRKLLVAKKRFDNNPDNEYKLHEKISELVGDWDTVKVPKLRWQFQSKWYNYIVMDFIEWKTLYHKIVEWIIGAKAKQIEANATWKTEAEKNIASCEAFDLRHKISGAKSDSDVDHIFWKWYEYDSNKTKEAFDREKWKVKIFWSEEWKKIKAELKWFIDMIHKNWFYHRDLHEKNIIFWDDGKIYVIDFWKSFFKDPKEGEPSTKDIYIVDIWEQTWRYPEDECILNIIEWVTKTEEDEENEEFAKQKKAEAKNLTKGEMVIESIDFSKIKSRKIKNGINDHFWWIDQLKRAIKKESKRVYTVDDFIDTIGEPEDFTLILFSITKENLDSILMEWIPNAKKIILKKIKDKRNEKLEEKDWNKLFGEGDVDVNKLNEVLKNWNKEWYEEIFSYMNVSNLKDIKPMQVMVKTIKDIEIIEQYLLDIKQALN